jgi:hypothetical protein
VGVLEDHAEGPHIRPSQAEAVAPDLDLEGVAERSAAQDDQQSIRNKAEIPEAAGDSVASMAT